jgi:hypothetical protein
MWDSLVNLKEAESSLDPAPAVASNRRPSWLWPAAAVGVLLLAFIAVWFIAVWATGVTKIKTPEGYIVLIDLDPQATVLVDGTRAEVHWPDGGGPAEITLVPGEHVIQVKKDGYKIQGEKVTVERDGRKRFLVQLEPLETPRLEKDAADKRPSPPATAGPAPADGDRVGATPTPKSPPVPGGNPNSHATVDLDKKNGKADLARAGANEPAQIRAIDAAIALRGKAEIVCGSWLVEGRELVQTDAGEIGGLLFGDLRWTDYDFTVEVMREKGLRHAGLIFHRTFRNNNHIGFGFGDAIGVDTDRCELGVLKDGEEHPLGRVGFHLVDRRWYRVRVSVRRTHIVCTIHDDQGNEHVHLKANYDRLPRGQVGLSTGRSSYRFRNIKVTAPDGKILWEIPPAIGAPPPAPGAAVAAPGQQAGKAVPLFNGKDLTGWSQPLDNDSEWRVTGGILEGRGGGGRKMALLVTERQDFRNFTLTVRFRFKRLGLGGIEVRRSGVGHATSCYVVPFYPEGPEGPWAGTITRLKDHEYGTDFPPVRESKTVTTAVNRWHSLTITVVGNRVTTTVNGVKADEYDDPRSGFRSGAIALWVAAESAGQFEAVEIQELPE